MADTEHYLNDMRSTTLEFARKWSIVAGHMKLAYSKAYQHQQKFLNDIKASIEEKKKKEEAMMTFTLGLLTGGIVGPIADRVVKKFMKGGELSTLKDVAGTVVHDSLLTEWTGDAFKTLVKAGDDKLRALGVDNLKSQVATAGFEPAGMTPDDYGTSLQLGIDERADAMSDIARVIHREYSGISPAVAEEVNKIFLSSPFFTDVPKKELKEDDVQRSAELMLWIAWGKLRDVEYWDKQKALYLYSFSEVWDWAPLLAEITRLGGSAKQIKVPSVKGWVATIDMPEFIKWSKGATAPKAAFDGVPTKADAVDGAIKQYLKKKT